MKEKTGLTLIAVSSLFEKQKVQEWKLYPFYQPGNITFR